MGTNLFSSFGSNIAVASIGKKEDEGEGGGRPLFGLYINTAMTRCQDSTMVKRRDNSVFLLKKTIGYGSSSLSHFSNKGTMLSCSFLSMLSRFHCLVGGSRCLLSHCLSSSSDMFSSVSFIHINESEEKSW